MATVRKESGANTPEESQEVTDGKVAVQEGTNVGLDHHRRHHIQSDGIDNGQRRSSKGTAANAENSGIDPESV